MKKFIFIATIFFTILVLNACKKNETPTYPSISDYYPLTVGKYVTYNMDSLVFTNFGTKLDTIHYQIQYVVDAKITDNTNRTAFRVIRYIRPGSTFPWVPDNTSSAVNTGNTIEFTEDNNKFLKLAAPITPGFSWPGNSYLYTADANTQALANWNYGYDSINAPITLSSLNPDYTTSSILVENTLKVNERNEIINNPSDLSLYSRQTYSTEKYAKGIGLIYRYFFYDEYQPSTTGASSGSNQGYGVILTMIDHN